MTFVVLLHLLLIVVAGLLLATPARASAQRVTIRSDGWELVGDLALPGVPGRVPAVLLLNGAGRDRSAYAALADELARRGIASLRLDLRAAGESTNLGRFAPGQPAPKGSEHPERDVIAARRWLAARPQVDAARIGVLGASYSGEAMAIAGRTEGWARAYVALSPGSFSDTSARAIDGSGAAWWILRGDDERFVKAWLDTLVRTHSRAEVTVLATGNAHASDLLSAHPPLAGRIAEWFAGRLGGERAAAAPAPARTERSADSGRVVAIDFVRAKPGELDRLLRFYELNWAAARRTALAQRHISGFRLHVNADSAGAWDVMLETEYPDMAAYERREEVFRPILQAKGRQLVDGKDGPALRDIIESRLTRVVTSEP